jgi:hypothetical protein
MKWGRRLIHRPFLELLADPAKICLGGDPLVLLLGVIQAGPSIVILGVVIWGWATTNTTGALPLSAYMVPVSSGVRLGTFAARMHEDDRVDTE